MERIRFYEYSLVFVSNVLITKFLQRCNCRFRCCGMRHCIIGPLDLSMPSFEMIGNQSLRRNVTSHETGIQSVELGLGLPEMLQSNTSCGETLQLHCTGFELCNNGTLRTDVCMFGHGPALLMYGFGLIPRVARFVPFRKESNYL